MKTNVNKEQALSTLIEVLSLDEMLLEFDVSVAPNRLTLRVEKESAKVEYTEVSKDNMVLFLNKLAERLPHHAEDVEEILEEINAA